MDVAQPLKQTDVERPWKNLGVEFGTDPVVKAMLNASIDIELGDGNLTLFRSDHWLGSESPCLVAPELCKLVQPHIRNGRSVAAALVDKKWIQDISGMLKFQAISEYLKFWPLLEEVELRSGVEDVIKWKWTPNATYSARSA